MSNETRRIIIKKGVGVPTVPSSNDHQDGTWIATDIYIGEFYLNTSTGTLYSRNSGGIVEIADSTDLTSKQDALISGTNIKTVNSSSLLGSGNLAVGDALVANSLSQFASTTSSQLAGVISDETGTGSLVFSDSPTFTGNISVSIPTTLTPTGTTETIDWNNGNGQILSLASATGTVVLTLSNPKAGATYFLKVIQHASSAKNITFPASVKFPSGTAPTISTGASAVDTIVLFFDGTNYYANFSQNYS